MRPLYLDHNASNPMDPRVVEVLQRACLEHYGNAGSPHVFGEQARHAVHRVRDTIAARAQARRHEVVFTSGATESNNLAIMGLADFGASQGRKHIVSTAIEHKSVLEPLAKLKRMGFDVTLVPPQPSGRCSARQVLEHVREDTLLVSVMHANNETGVLQPIEAIAEGLQENSAYLHVDAAQTFARTESALTHKRIDMISVSGHKVFGPQGIGALVLRKRSGEYPPIEPLMLGGGQEMGFRPGTLPVPLILAFGAAVELAVQEYQVRHTHCNRLRAMVMQWVHAHGGMVHGDPATTLPHVVNVAFPGRTSDQVMDELSQQIAISDGSACTSVCATASHVLAAMNIGEPALSGAVRISWSHLTDPAHLEQALASTSLKLAR